VPPRGGARPGRWGWDSRAGWKAWASQVAALLAEGFSGTLFGVRAAGQPGEAVPSDFRPQAAIVDHPAMLSTVRAALPATLVFDCLEDPPAPARSRTLAAAYEEELERGLALVDGIVAVNRYLLESWERRLRPEAARTVIEHGVDAALFRPANEELRRLARERLGLPAERRVAAFLGRIDARISFEDLEHILETDPGMHLLLLGEVGSEGEAILRRLARGRVTALGLLRQSEAAALLPAADLLLIPYRREPEMETLRGLKLYEYLATGLPVVASFRRGLKALRELLYLYTTWGELDEALRRACAEPSDGELRSGRIAVAREADWTLRAAAFSAFLEQAARSRPA